MHPDKTKRIPRKDRSLQSLFTAADAHTQIDAARREDTLLLLQRELRTRTIRPLRDKKLLVLNLLRYTDRYLPAFHLLSCIAMLFLLFVMGNPDFPVRMDTRIMMLTAMTLPCFLVLFPAFEFRRICFTGMAELNETCFFHVRQIAALSMLASGLLNLMTVSAAILLVGSRWKIRLLQIGLYMLVPFIFMQCVCFGCLLLEPVRRHTWLSALFLFPVSMLCLAAVQSRTLYRQSALFFWAAALFAGIAVLAAEMKLLFIKLDKGELLCTDWN